MTTDAPAAMKFYSEVPGWPSETMDMGPLGKYHMFNRPHGMIGGMMNKPPELAHVPPNWQIYFRVPDINAAVARIKTNGGQILNGPMRVPGDWIVNGMDPQGAAFSLHAKTSVTAGFGRAAKLGLTIGNIRAVSRSHYARSRLAGDLCLPASESPGVTACTVAAFRGWASSAGCYSGRRGARGLRRSQRSRGVSMPALTVRQSGPGLADFGCTDDIISQHTIAARLRHAAAWKPRGG